jgi:hypothetical protein
LDDVFLSYSSQDREREALVRLVAALEQSGLSVFWDRKIPPGMTWRTVLQQRLTQARTILVVWTNDSVASEWVHEEADHGRARDILFPVLLDKVMQPIGFGGVQAADLSEWDGNPGDPVFQALLHAIHFRARAVVGAGYANHASGPAVLMSSPSLTAHTQSLPPAPRSSRRFTGVKMAVVAAAFGVLGVVATATAFVYWPGPSGGGRTTTTPTAPAFVAAAASSPTAAPVLPLPSPGRPFFEDFSRRETVRSDFWLLGLRGPWNGGVTGNSYKLCNQSGSERAFQARTLGVFDDKKLSADLPNVSISMSVKLTGTISDNAAVGILFSWTPEHSYVFARGPGRSLVVLQGEPGRLKLVRSVAKGPAEEEFATLRVESNGKQARLMAGNDHIDSVASSTLGSDRIGFFRARGGLLRGGRHGRVDPRPRRREVSAARAAAQTGFSSRLPSETDASA